MADISISPLAPREFRVQVREGDRETTHQVTVPERLGEGLELRDDDLERVVRESFRFLLERERATSILAQFSLSDISRYFPEYPSEQERDRVVAQPSGGEQQRRRRLPIHPVQVIDHHQQRRRLGGDGQQR